MHSVPASYYMYLVYILSLAFSVYMYILSSLKVFECISCLLSPCVHESPQAASLGCLCIVFWPCFLLSNFIFRIPFVHLLSEPASCFLSCYLTFEPVSLSLYFISESLFYCVSLRLIAKPGLHLLPNLHLAWPSILFLSLLLVLKPVAYALSFHLISTPFAFLTRLASICFLAYTVHVHLTL